VSFVLGAVRNRVAGLSLYEAGSCFRLILANGAAPVHVPSIGPGLSSMYAFLQQQRDGRASPTIGATNSVDEAMTAISNKDARLTRDIQTKIGEKLALLYVPVLRQDMPQRLSELSRRLEKPGESQQTARSPLSRMLEALRRRRAGSGNP
jgi:hypothetical protein